jgi:hypothetical protein
MTLTWTPENLQKLQTAMAQYPASSGQCTALARQVYRVACEEDPQKPQGVHLKPKGSARYIVALAGRGIYWASHTLIETRQHALDALTGPPGFPAGAYLGAHFENPDHIQTLHGVDLDAIDPGIQDL